MRVFLCVFGDYTVAIPMDVISSLYLHSNTKHLDTLEYDMGMHRENTAVYVSLPWFFNLPPENIRHCIVLKNLDGYANKTTSDKVILLSTPVECEIEIPDKKIYPIPKVFNNKLFSMLFNGIQFTSDTRLTLLLNTERLIQHIHKGKAL